MDKNNNALVELLLSLKNTGNRAKLAALRRGASDPFNNFEALSIIGKVLPDQRDSTFKNSMLLATLFAVNPLHREDRNLGAALRKVRNSLVVGAESLDGRFTLLLNAEYEDLPHHLMQTFRFLANREIGIDFQKLFDDLKYWAHRDKFVQLRWAKEYWGRKKEEEEVKNEENNNH